MTTKTLVASLAAVAASSVLVAQGEVEPAWNSSLKGTTINAVGFERFDVDDTPGTGVADDGSETPANAYFLYSGTNGDDQSAVKSHESEVDFPSSVPGYFSTFANGKYLSLSTEGGTLFRSLNALDYTDSANPALGTAEAILDAGLYVDTLVQFTPCEEAPTFTDNANKLAVWLNVTETEGVFETNLCVRAGYWTYENPEDPEKPVLERLKDGATYTLANTDKIQIEAGEWVRLTVKAIRNVYAADNTGVMPAFQVYINDTLAEFTEAVGTEAALAQIAKLDNAAGTTLATKTVLPSMQDAVTLQAVGFQGTGAIDDFVVTTDKPNFLAVDFTLYWDTNVAQLEAYLNYVDNSTPAIEYTLNDLKVALGAAAAVAGNKVSFFLQEGTYGTYAKDGYVIDWANTVCTNVEMKALGNPVYGYEFTAVREGPYSITLVTKATTPTVTPDSAVVVAAEKAEDAIAKVEISITDEEAAAAGQKKVVKKVATETSPGSKEWNVTVVIDEEAEDFVDPDVAVAEVAGALSGTGTSVSIAKEKLTPGLYYSLGTATAVDGTYTEGTRVLATGSAISFDLDKSGTAGFFKVFVNMTGNTSAE